MRIVRYGVRGHERLGILDNGATIVDVEAAVGGLDDILSQGQGLEPLRRLKASKDFAKLERVALSGQRLGAPVSRPHQILCIGLNYADHAEESGMQVPEEPVIFNKAPNTLVGPDDQVVIPRGASSVDWEVELGVVIGQQATYLPSLESAAGVIAGYCVVNDVSERDFQLHRGGQWVKGKSCPTFNPCGPWLVTPDEVGDPQSLGLRLWLNGEVMQDGSTDTMVFGVHHVVWYVSQFMTLEPGDLICTGTPPGVGMGMDPQRYLTPGDVMELEIDGLGRQRQQVSAPM